VKHAGEAMLALCDELESDFAESQILEDAPFDVIHLIIHFGEKNGPPKLSRINKVHSELEATIELSMNDISHLDFVELKKIFRDATIEVVLATAEKYNLNDEYWKNI